MDISIWPIRLKACKHTYRPKITSYFINNKIQEHYLNNSNGHHGSNIKILDVGCGTGVLGIMFMLSTAFECIHITMIDKQNQAIKSTITNLRRHKCFGVDLKKEDAFKSVEKNKQYSIVISNIPYVNKTLFALKHSKKFYSSLYKSLSGLKGVGKRPGHGAKIGHREDRINCVWSPEQVDQFLFLYKKKCEYLYIECDTYLLNKINPQHKIVYSNRINANEKIYLIVIQGEIGLNFA